MISGKILSTEKEVVDFATVYLKGTGYGGITNHEGIYHVSAPAGDYTLVVSAVVYKTVVNGRKPHQAVGIQCCGGGYERAAEHHEEPE